MVCVTFSKYEKMCGIWIIKLIIINVQIFLIFFHHSNNSHLIIVQDMNAKTHWKWVIHYAWKISL